MGEGPLLGVRHLQILLLFFNRIILFSIRTHIPVTMVAMTNAEKSNPAQEEYHWTEVHKSYILSSLYLGEIIMSIPGACWVRRFGIKINLFVITLAMGTLNALVPVLMPWGGWKIFCLLRFLQGLFGALGSPIIMKHLANWSPPAERNRFGGIVSMGLDIGIFFAIFLSGGVSKSSIGWPGVFYVISSLSLLWGIIWLIFGADNAQTSKFISHDERVYIETSHDKSLEFNRKRLPIPWLAICTSMPFWAIVITRAAFSGAFVTIQAEFPAYMNGIFEVNIMDNALYSALPYVSAFLMVFLCLAMLELIQGRKLLSLTASRKCFNSISTWIPAAGMIWIGFFDKKKKFLVIFVNTFMMGPTCAVMFGAVLSGIDIAPNHAEVISAIVELFCKSTSLLGPIIAGAIVNDETDRFQWQILFAGLAVLFCTGDLIFLIFGTSKEQAWNSTDYLKQNADRNNENSKTTQI